MTAKTAEFYISAEESHASLFHHAKTTVHVLPLDTEHLRAQMTLYCFEIPASQKDPV